MEGLPTRVKGSAAAAAAAAALLELHTHAGSIILTTQRTSSARPPKQMLATLAGCSPGCLNYILTHFSGESV